MVIVVELQYTIMTYMIRITKVDGCFYRVYFSELLGSKLSLELETQPVIYFSVQSNLTIITFQQL